MEKTKMEVVYKDGKQVRVEKFKDRISGFEVDRRFGSNTILVRYK